MASSGGDLVDRFEMRLPCDVKSVAAARRFVSARLLEWTIGADGTAVTFDHVVLVTSELVSNAVRFCAHDMRVRVERHTLYLEVAVADDNPGLPVPRTTGSEDESGRGLAIVEALASEWGVVRDPPGKVVWARLPFS